MLAFGNAMVQSGSLAVQGWLFDVKNAQSPQVLGKQYRELASEDNARLIAHRFADEIIFRLGGGIPGIAESKIFFVSSRGGTKEIWQMDYDGSNQKQITHVGTMALSPHGSPDGSRVAYVRGNNLYVEDPAQGGIVQLTTDGSTTIINGTFDWVYEEEFSLHDGFRWSPDGARIAYWQLDAAGVRDFLLINDTDSLYSHVIPVQYPKVGTTLSACRVGVVSAAGGPTTWFRTGGDPRNNYIPRMDWAGSGEGIAFQYMNRLQDTNRLMLADPRSGSLRTILTESDSTWEIGRAHV
jgi:dipeptidyl-peptidase-4